MLKLFHTIAVLAAFFALQAVYAVDSPRTAMIGGVDLFDTESPMVGVQNPALLYDYGRIEPVGALWTNSSTNLVTNIQAVSLSITNTLSITNKNKKTKKIQVRVTNVVSLSNAQATNVYTTNTVSVIEAPARYHVGRFFLLNPYITIGASGDLLTSFKYYTAMFQGQMSGTPEDQAAALRSAMLILSFGLIDIQPMFATNKASVHDIVSNMIQASQSKSGFYLGMNMNLLSYNRDRVGSQ